MKKTLMGLALAAMTMMMVACGGSDSPKSLAEKAAKAAKAGDEKTLTEIEQKVEKMSEEDQAEFVKEFTKLAIEAGVDEMDF